MLADIFLHELLHLDLAANSVNNDPNPQIRDILIRYTANGSGSKSRWTKVYGPKLAKILARFLPISPSSKQTGYFVQRNDDNFVGFALANYVQSQVGYYPFLPVIYDKIADAPRLPPDRQSTDPFIVYTADGDNPVDFDNFTTADDGGARNLEDSGSCPTVLSTGSGEDLQIGAPNPTDAYPSSYWDQRTKWLQSLDTDSSGTCKLTVEEIWTCEATDSNLYASVQITDATGNNIYSTPASADSPGQPIDAGHSLSIQANGLANSLVVTGEHTNDYIQFAYGSTSWQSGTTGGQAHCSLSGNNWNAKGPQGCPKAQAIVSTCL